MLLTFEDGRPFAQGAAAYSDHRATPREATPRIFVQVKIEGIQAEAVVDTAAVYFVCHPEIADLLDLDPADELCTDKLEIRGQRVRGTIHRVRLTLLADEGHSIEMDVTAFVPRLEPHGQWALPSVMGLSACLEYMRFAVDPVTNTFYFGTLPDGE